LRAEHALEMKLYRDATTAWDGYHQVEALRHSIDAVSQNAPADVASAAHELDTKLEAVGGSASRGRGGFRGARQAAPPNFNALEGTMIRQLTTMDQGDMAPNEPMLKGYAASCAELSTAVGTWRTLTTRDLTAFNALLAKNQLAPVPAPAPALPAPTC
jgi:hypothetical protein